MRTRATQSRGFALVLASLVGCSASTEKPAVDVALKDDALRASTFEATAEELDEHGEWVDEMYRVARRHPAMLERFLWNAAKDLSEPELADQTSRLLVQHPRSVEQVLKSAVDACAPRKACVAAMNRAMRARRAALAGILLSDETTLRAMMGALANKAGNDRGALDRALRAILPNP